MGCRKAIFVLKSTIDFPIFSYFLIQSFLFSYFFEQPCHWTPCNFEISRVIFMPNITYKSCYHYFVYNTTCKWFVILTFRYFKLSWNTTVLSQSNCRNFSCSSIIADKTNIQTNFYFDRDLCFVIQYAWISKLLHITHYTLADSNKDGRESCHVA